MAFHCFNLIFNKLAIFPSVIYLLLFCFSEIMRWIVLLVALIVSTHFMICYFSFSQQRLVSSRGRPWARARGKRWKEMLVYKLEIY